MRTLRLLTLCGAATLVAACTLDGTFGGFLPQGKGTPSPSPTPACTIASEQAAPIFHVAFTSPASAGATVTLEPWVYLEAPVMVHDAVLPETFAAQVREQTREIVITGKVRTTRPNPGANCAFPALYTFPIAATLSLPVVLPASGTYTVRIASESFTTERPPEVTNPSLPPKVYPAPAATRSLVIN